MKKLKTILFALMLSVTLMSCGGDKEKALKNVKEIFPNSKIYQFEGRPFTFYVIDSTGIKRVTCLNTTDDDIDGISTAVEK